MSVYFLWGRGLAWLVLVNDYQEQDEIYIAYLKNIYSYEKEIGGRRIRWYLQAGVSTFKASVFETKDAVSSSIKLFNFFFF